jgi:FKBP-type peptidyl-prolyl cis-trans isomerase 2
LLAFEKGFIGAEIGSKKTLVLPPEEAFGEWNESLVIPIPKVAAVPLISDVPRNVFETGAGKEPVMNDTVQLKYWPAMVVDVTEDTVTLQSLPENGSIVVTDYAPAEVTLNSTHAILELIPRPGIAYTPMGPARAVAEDQTSILFDYNHPLAGKTLVFETVVRNITKLQKN